MSTFWNFVTSMTSGTLAKAEDVNTNLQGIDTGLDLVETELNKAVQITNVPGTTDLTENVAARANKFIGFDVSGDIVALAISALASQVTIVDAGGHLTASDVEAALAEIAVLTKFLSVTQAVNLDTMETNANASKVVTDWITVTQAVNLDTIETNSGASKVITDFITITQAVNLDTVESDAAASKVITDWITVTQAVNLDTIESNTATNNAKVTNANHTGDATGATALTLAAAAITSKTALASGLATTDEILVSDAGVLKRMDISVLTAHIVALANTWALDQTFTSDIIANGELTINAGYSEDADQYTATTGTRTLNTAIATYWYPSADLGTATITFVFSNPAASGRVTSFTMELLGADGATLTWPTGVDWAGGVQPTWTSGVDVITFITRDGGTTWLGFTAGLDMK